MNRSMILAAALALVGTVASADAIDSALQSLADQGATHVEATRGTETTKIEGTLNGKHFEMSVRNTDGTVVNQETGSGDQASGDGTEGSGDQGSEGSGTEGSGDGNGQEQGDGSSSGEHGSDGDGGHDGGEGGHDGGGDGGGDGGHDGGDGGDGGADK